VNSCHERGRHTRRRPPSFPPPTRSDLEICHESSRKAIGEACRRGGIGEVRKRAAWMVINRQFIVRY